MANQLVTYDQEHGLAYIYLFGKYPPGSAVRTLGVPMDNPTICLDFDSNGALIGIELLTRALLHPELAAIAVKPGPDPQ